MMTESAACFVGLLMVFTTRSGALRDFGIRKSNLRVKPLRPMNETWDEKRTSRSSSQPRTSSMKRVD